MVTKNIEGVDNANPNNYGGFVSRKALLSGERAQYDFTKGIPTVATTENPALVVDWERWEIVREVLPMKYMESPSNDKVPFLDSHDRSSLDKVLGSARNFKAQADELQALVFISDTEKELQQKIKEGHVDSVSIGYRTKSEETIEIPQGKMVVIDGQTFRNDFNDGIPYLVRTWWKVHELSGVAIGADEAAKFKSANQEQKALVQKIGELQKEIAELRKQLQPETPAEKTSRLTYAEVRAKILQYENN